MWTSATIPPGTLYQCAPYADPKAIAPLIDRVEKRIGTPAQVEGFQFTHDTSDISPARWNPCIPNSRP